MKTQTLLTLLDHPSLILSEIYDNTKLIHRPDKKTCKRKKIISSEITKVMK